MHVLRRAVGAEVHIKHPFGDNATLARAREAGILDCVFEVEEHAWLHSGVALVHQDGAAFQQVAVAFQGEVDDRVEQRMAWANKCCQRLALRRDQRLLEGDTFIARQDGVPNAD